MQSQKLSYYGNYSVVISIWWIPKKISEWSFVVIDVGKALKSMVATEGVAGLWRGLGPTVFRDVPFSGIYWAVYESIKKQNDVTVPTFWFSFFGGAIAGSVCHRFVIRFIVCSRLIIIVVIFFSIAYLFIDCSTCNSSIWRCKNASTNWIWWKSAICGTTAITAKSWNILHFTKDIPTKWFARSIRWCDTTCGKSCTSLCHNDHLIWIWKSLFLPAQYWGVHWEKWWHQLKCTENFIQFNETIAWKKKQLA